MTLGRLLERAALRRPSADAVVDGAAHASYSELWLRTGAVAHGLGRLGIGKGDRVLIALKNRIEHVTAYWALQRLGGVPVPVNFRFAPDEMAYVLEDSGARAVLFEPATTAAILEAVGDRALPRVFVGGDPPEGAVPWAELTTHADGPDVAVSEGDLSPVARRASRARTAITTRAPSRTPSSAGTTGGSAPSASCRSITRWGSTR